MGKEDYLGPILVVDFVYYYFVDSVSKGMVVDFFANNASIYGECHAIRSEFVLGKRLLGVALKWAAAISLGLGLCLV